MYEFFYAIENVPWLLAFSESLFLYPVVLGIHLLGISLAVGLLALADLHLAGVLWRQLSPQEVLGSLRPWFLSGFAVVFISGFVLFIPRISLYYNSTVFWVKAVLIALAGLNAWYFERVYRTGARSSTRVAGRTTRVSARTSGLASLGLWTAIVVLGRLLAYF